MKTLGMLTMSQYIDMICGDLTVLKEKGEVVTDERLAEHRAALASEFAELADRVAAKSAVNDGDAKRRAKAELTLFKVLTNLLALGAHKDVRTILKDYGYAREMDDRQTAIEVARLLRRAETAMGKIGAEKKDERRKPPGEKEIRAGYDSQAASLMAWFKFQIDLRTIPASQFACLIDQANRQAAAQLNAYKRK